MKTKHSLQVLDYIFNLLLVLQMEDEIVDLEFEVEEQPCCSNCSTLLIIEENGHL